MVTTRGGTARKRSANTLTNSTTKIAKTPRVAWASNVSGTKTARRGGQDFSTLASQTRNDPNSTINQLKKLKKESYERSLKVLGNNLSREIQKRQNVASSKMTSISAKKLRTRGTAVSPGSKPSPMATRNGKKLRTRETARTSKATPKTLARQMLTNEQFRNQITKILNTQKLSKAQLLKLKNNANQRNGMKNISNRINPLLIPVRSTPKTPGRPMSARGKTSKTPGRPMSARGKTPKTPGRPKSAPVVNKAYKVAATKMVNAIKTAYLTVIKRRIETISKRTERTPAKLYFLYDTFRIVSASVIHRRWVKLYGMPSTIDENKIEEDLDENFIPVYENAKKVVRLKNISETQQTVINFNQQQLFRWFFLMWLDSHHDGTTSATSTFFTYLNFINVNKNFIQRAIKSYDYRNDVLLTSGSFGKIIENGDITPPTKGRFEAIMKTQLFKFFKNSNNVVSVRRQSNITNGKLSVALDQENAASISLFISGNHNNTVNKITVANFMDPGVYMQNGIGLNDDFDKFFVSNSNNAEMFKRLNNDYIVNTFSFSLRYKNVPFMELRTFLNSYKNLDPVSYEKSRPIKLEMKYLMNNDIISDWKDVTPSKKEKNTTFEGVMNKYFGDCLQGLVVATNNKFRPNNPIHLATGDGAFVGVFGNICDAMDVPTRLVVDNAIAEGILDIYYLPDNIQITGLINKPNASGNAASSQMF